MIAQGLTVIGFALAICLQAAIAVEAPLPPNVLLVVADDMNNDLGAYGNTFVQTPNIDRLAQSGVVFTHAYAQYPQCNQSRASFLTSRYPDQTGILSLKEHVRDTMPDVVTLPQHFRNHGYTTVRVGKVFHQGVPTEIGQPGLDDARSWDVTVNPIGVDKRVEDKVESIAPPELEWRRFGGTLSWLRLESEEKHTDQIGADEAIRLMGDYHPDRTGKPLFLALGFYRPHTPFVAPGRWYDAYPPEKVQLVEVPPGDRENKPIAALADRRFQAEMTDQQKRQAIQGYYASISFVDEQLGKVLGALERHGLADNTLIVFVSDHGYQLGSHGLWQKRDLFENSTRAPLIMVAPGRLQAGLRSAAPVELLDIYPTLTALAGLPQPETALQGMSLVEVVAGNEPSREAALSQSWSAAHLVRPVRRGLQVMGYSIRTSRYRYTEWDGGQEGVELYDYSSDPLEYRNLAEDEAYLQVVRELKATLDNKLRSIHQSD
ncbi:MAG: sulfatase [Lysobacterales bacterium]|jgi:arylsulfatase A-like enzyme